MKKISKVATASVLLFTLANPLAVFAENRGGNVSETSSNKTTQDLTITSEEINGDIVFHVTAVRDTYDAIVYAKINGKNYTYNLGNLKKGQVSKIVQPDASINNNSASISKESKKEKSLPNTSVVRELVQKTVFYNNEINGNIVEAKVVYKVYEMIEKNSTQNKGREYFPESNVKEGAIVKPEVLVKPEYKEILGGAIVEPAVQPELPKAEEPAVPAPKVDEPTTPAPKTEEPTTPTPKAEEPAAPAPKAEEPTTPTPKAEEPTTPAPKAEEPAAPAPKAEEPAAPAPKAEEPAAPAPKVEEPMIPAPKADESTTLAPKVEKPAVPAPKAEEPTTPAPKAEESATPAPKEDTPSEEVAPKDEKLEEAKKDGKDVIEKIAASKLSEIEKVKDEAEKAKLEAKLKELKEAGLEAINNAKDHDAAVDAADEYQTKIDEINVPGEELPAPNYNKDNLTNGRNEGTTIDNGSTAIGHGSGEATATAPTQPASTSEGTASFRKAPEVQVRARRVARAANQPDGTVNISYNYDGMPDINGFLSDPGENNTVAIPNSATEDEVKELVKAKIQAKAQELAKHGYKVKEEIVFEQDTIVKNFNYVVTFTKEKTGTTGFRIAPEVQVRAKKVVKRDLSNKTKQINIYYNLTNLKDIAGALGEVGENNMLTLSGNATKEEIKKAIEEKTKSQIEKLNKQGFKVTSTTDLDQIVEGGDRYDYVVEFTKESKSTLANNTGFRKAPLIQKRAKRSAEGQETVDVNIYFNLKTLPGIAGALDVDGDTTIKLPKNATEAQVKAAIQGKIAKVEKRGYKVTDAYFGAKTEHGYDFIVEFKK